MGYPSPFERRWNPLGAHNRVRIPPLPQQIIMTDRDDGTLWLLTYSGDHIAINSVFNARNDTTTYGPYDGPILSDGEHNDVRLLVRGGYLGYEADPAPPNRFQARVMARLGVSRTFFEIIVPSTWVGSPDVLGYEEVEI